MRKIWNTISLKFKNASLKTILITAAVCTAALVLIILGVLHAQKAGMVQKKVDVWLNGEIDDLTGKETAEAVYSQEYLDSMELLRMQYGDFLEAKESQEDRSLLDAVLQRTGIDISLPFLFSFPLDTEMTVTGPDMVQLLDDMNDTSDQDGQTLKKNVLAALESGSYPVRTVRVPVTLIETDGVVSAEASADAVAALYGGLSERYADIHESMLAQIDQTLEGQVN